MTSVVYDIRELEKATETLHALNLERSGVVELLVSRMTGSEKPNWINESKIDPELIDVISHIAFRAIFNAAVESCRESLSESVKVCLERIGKTVK